jgi:hypothetical protein
MEMTIGQKIVHKYKAEYRQAPPPSSLDLKLSCMAFAEGPKLRRAFLLAAAIDPSGALNKIMSCRRAFPKNKKRLDFFLGERCRTTQCFYDLFMGMRR